MTSPGPDWVEQARRLVVASGLADVLTAGRAPGAARADAAAAGAPEDRAASGTPEDRAAAAGAPEDHAAECRWCPLCLGLAALRGRRPDLVEGLADLLSTAATALRTHAADPAAERAGASPADPVGEEPGAAGPPPVQRIDVA